MKTRRRILLPLLLLCAALCLLALSAAAETETGSCGEKLTYTLDTESGLLTISGTGEMTLWNITPKSPFAGDGRIRKVVVEDGVLNITRNTFKNCSQLAVVELSASVNYIGSQAFLSCSKLERVTILCPTCEIYPNGQTIPQTAAIAGYVYSTAQTYAEDIGNDFVSLGVAPHEHTFAAEYTPDLAATCINTGIESRHCTVRGCAETTDKRTIPVDNTAHDFNGEYTIDTPATCTKKGEKSRHCLRCDARTNITEIPTEPHSWGDWQVRTPATCTETGVDYHVCAVCNAEETRDSEVLGHDFVNAWIVDTPATCVANGEKSKHCSRCDAKNFVRAIPATGVHIYRDYTCIYCGKTTETYAVGDGIAYGSYPQTRVTDEKLLAALNAADGTWVSYGYYLKNQPDDYMQYKDVELDGEKYRAVQFSTYRPQKTYDAAYKPGSESGAEQYTNGYFANTVYWFRYEPLAWRVLDATYEKNLLVFAMSVLDAQPFAQKGNDYAASVIRTWLNDSFVRTAFSADETAFLKEAALADVGVTDKVFLLSLDDMTNTAYGFSDSTSSDDARSAMGTDYAKAQGMTYNLYSGNAHWLLRTAKDSFSDVYRTAYDGNITSTLSYFNFNGTRPAMRLNPTGKACTHNWTVTDTQAPTCVEDGSTTSACTVCGETKTEPIPASGAHDYDTAFTVDTPATCTETGEKLRHCKASGCTARTEVTEIPAMGHAIPSEPTEAEIPPTCKAPGKKAVYRCTHDGCTYFEGGEEIPQKKYGDVNGDGEVSKSDLLRLQKHLAGWDVTIDREAADCNGDGQIAKADLLRLQKFLAGWDVKLGEK